LGPGGRRSQAKPASGRPIAIAITGGIGAGKSEALRAFARHGAATISSDEIVHRLLREDDEVRAEIVGRLGRGVLDPSGEIDRGAVGRRVFGDPERVAWLEGLVHPRVIREYLEWRKRLAALPEPPAACATEVPLLYEVGGESQFDVVVVVTAPLDVRTERNRLAADPRAERLIPDEEKIARADFAFVNDGSLEELDAFVAGVLEQAAARA
jgi:dephospho-CoA kinase